MQFKGVLFTLVNRHAEDVRRQQVTGELDALVVGADDPGQGMRQGGLPDTRHVLDKEVTAGQQAAEGQVDLLVLAEQDPVDSRLCILQSLQTVLSLAHSPLPAHGRFL